MTVTKRNRGKQRNNPPVNNLGPVRPAGRYMQNGDSGLYAKPSRRKGASSGTNAPYGTPYGSPYGAPNGAYYPQGMYTASANGGGAYGNHSASGYSRSSSNYSRKKKPSKAKKLVIAVLIVCFVLCLGAGGAFALYMKSINEELNQGNKTDQEIMEINDSLSQTSYDEPFYMLLIGSDAREGNDAEGKRSDTNIVARIDPNNYIVTLISIPRDTKIELEGYGTQKFNAVYGLEGVAGTIREANKLLGIEISHYAEVDFSGLVDVVDSLGGVDIEIEEIIDDPDAGDQVIPAGLQHLDGEKALIYARTRQYVDGDFTRSKHQRILINALAEKALSLQATDLPNLISTITKYISTDMSIQDICSLALKFKNAGDFTMYSAMVPSSTATIDGVSYVITDTEGLKSMMQLVEAGQDPNNYVPGTTSSTATSSTDSSTSSSSASSTESGGYYSSGSSEYYYSYDSSGSYSYGSSDYSSSDYSSTGYY